MQLSKFVLLVFTLLISSQITWAQTTKNDTISLIPKWEVGLNLLSLFNEGNVPKASIFLGVTTLFPIKNAKLYDSVLD